MSVAKLDPVLLWPAGAPGARGTGPEDCPRLTPYLPAHGPRERACVVVCPGGGYGGRAAHEGEPIARWLCGLGLAACVLDYRVAPYRHPIPLGDAQQGLRLVRQRAADWRIDPRRVGILGFSAGGHLATSAATLFTDAATRPDALIACYPVISFTAHRHQGSLLNLLGDPPAPGLMEQLSLERRVTPQTPPTFIWHTADDAAVPVQNALLLAGALRHHGVPFALHVFPNGRHGLGLAADQPVVGQWPALCAQWLASLGFAD